MGIEGSTLPIWSIIKHGVLGGIIAGILLSLFGHIFKPNLPTEFRQLSESLQLTLAARFLYGGLTEEILMRFGLMTMIVWLFSKILRGTKPATFWVGILLAAFIFALGHFPVAYQAVGDPSYGLLTYIFIANSVGGVIFGWLYWKKGLESSFVAHMFTHVILVMIGPT